MATSFQVPISTIFSICSHTDRTSHTFNFQAAVGLITYNSNNNLQTSLEQISRSFILLQETQHHLLTHTTLFAENLYKAVSTFTEKLNIHIHKCTLY